jgi:hypothetical protein
VIKVQYIYRKNTKAKPHSKMNRHLKNKGQEYKTSYVKEGTSGRGRVNIEHKGG